MSARLARCGKTGRPPGGARAQETRKSHGCSAASTRTANRQKCQTCTQSAREPWIRKEHEIRHGVLAETQLDGLRPANPLGRYPCPLANAIPIQQRTAPFHDAFGRRRAPQSAHKARNRPVRRFFWLGGTSPLPDLKDSLCGPVRKPQGHSRTWEPLHRFPTENESLRRRFRGGTVS